MAKTEDDQPRDLEWTLQLLKVKDSGERWVNWVTGSLEDCLSDLMEFRTGGWGETYDRARLVSASRSAIYSESSRRELEEQATAEAIATVMPPADQCTNHDTGILRRDDARDGWVTKCCGKMMVTDEDVNRAATSVFRTQPLY